MKPARPKGQKPPAKPAAKPPAKPAVKPAAKPAAKPVAKPPKQSVVAEEELTAADIPTHPPEVEVAEPTPPPPPPPPRDLLTAGDPVKTLGFIESIIGTLTFRTVGLVALLTAIGLFLFALYENRDAIVTRFTRPAAPVVTPVATVGAWTLSEASKQSLIGLAKATNVKIVILSDVDLKKNRRIAKYYYIDDPDITLSPLALQALTLPLPVFDYDAKNTEQMIAILSNDFRCDPFADTVYNRFAPEMASTFPTVCRMAVPPFVGTFVGFITVGVAANITPIELETIRLEVSRIAVEIYMNDVAKKPATTPIN